MRVDFYQVSRDPVPEIVALLARNTLKAGERLLVVAEDAALRTAIGEALWRAAPADSFLANGPAEAPHAERQPILLADGLTPANGARYLALADGVWREPEGFARVFLVFDGATLEAARACWRMLGERDGLERNFWKQDEGRWVKAA
ncbi:MAG: DNA polymerase III subunit chi [Sphingomonadales bacterium]|nr:DNA polymerase III subunit chi [Sphingomonadales bacterium]